MTPQFSERGVSVSGRRFQHFTSTLADKYGDKSKKLSITDAETLRQLGISANKNAVMDAAVALQTTASITNPVQFLQTILPGLVRVFQAPMTLDELIGFTQAGFWEDAEIIQRWVERTGLAREYGDSQAKPNTSWNMNFVKRNVVRFEVGLEVHKLQEMRASRGMISDVTEKREEAELLLRQMNHNVGWFGYNSGNNLTYGYSNDPGLPAYVPVASTGTGSSPLWSNKTWQQQQNDLVAMASGLMTQSKGRVNPMKDECTLNIPVSMASYFTTTNSLGTQTLEQWMKVNYPNTRIIYSPQMDGLNGGLNAMYWYADKITGADAGTDGGDTFRQVIPAHFMALGTQPLVDGYKEAFSCATAGVFALRPIAIYRASSM